MARVLVVDDDSSVVMLLQKVLEGAGHAVSTARTGAEATFRLQTKTFDCAVIDKHLPDVHGAQLITLARDLQPHIAIVLTTARSDRFGFHQVELDAFLPKPYLSLEAPRQAVEEALAKRKEARDRRPSAKRLPEPAPAPVS